MITLRKSSDRGHFNHGWMDTFHTFSFAEYSDPAHMGFRSLRVINEDRVAADSGFGTHGHRDMEIITYILSGQLVHKDSMGNGSIIYPGQVQKMSAGTGITHSEFNPSKKEAVHLLQIWILPEERGIVPNYEQYDFEDVRKKNRLCLVASSKPPKGAAKIYQDADLFVSILDAGTEVRHEIKKGHAWIQVAKGSIRLNKDHVLKEGDGAAVSGEKEAVLSAEKPSEILLFDLA